MGNQNKKKNKEKKPLESSIVHGVRVLEGHPGSFSAFYHDDVITKLCLDLCVFWIGCGTGF